MSAHALTLPAAVEAVSALALPANCERIATTYVGQLAFSLVRDPRDGMLFLSSPWGFHALDPQQLLATYATALRAWDRERGWIDGRAAPRLVEEGATRRLRATDGCADHSSTAGAGRAQATTVRQLALARRRADRHGGSRRRRQA